MINADIAVDNFFAGFNCAQSTAMAFAKELNLDSETLRNLLAGFGGGVGGTRGMCGAVTGMVAVLSFANGTYDPQDTEKKTALYTNVREAIEDFREKFGTDCCKDLLLRSGCFPKPDPSVRNAEYYATRPCAHFVHEAAEIASRRMKKKS